MIDLRNVDYVRNLIEVVPVYALVELVNYEFAVVETYITEYTYNFSSSMYYGGQPYTYKISYGMGNCIALFEREVEAVDAMAQIEKSGPATKVLLDLYRYRYPELGV